MKHLALIIAAAAIFAPAALADTDATVDQVTCGGVNVTHGPGTYRVVVFLDTRLAVNVLSSYPAASFPGPAGMPSSARAKRLVVGWPVRDRDEHAVDVWVGAPDGYPQDGVWSGTVYAQCLPVVSTPAVVSRVRLRLR